ncbi:DUF86 domain-containing protein [Georgenia sp. TF02-10]|uniref:HepT-like ribonuclease domain-containing protein n=1 Tax=Georgenia sp. TF02-10 TaxID=2917725 RepID=UPI00352FA3FB
MRSGHLARKGPDSTLPPVDGTDEDTTQSGDDYFAQHGFRRSTRPFDPEQTRRRLSDILEQARICARIVSDGRRAFDADTFAALKTRMAAQRSIEIIAEAASKLHSDYKKGFPGVQWHSLYQMRTLAVHQDDRVRDDVIWATLSTNVPEMVSRLGLPAWPTAASHCPMTSRPQARLGRIRCSRGVVRGVRVRQPGSQRGASRNCRGPACAGGTGPAKPRRGTAPSGRAAGQ